MTARLVSCVLILTACGFATYRAPVVVDGEKPSVKCKPGRSGFVTDLVLGLAGVGGSIAAAIDDEDKLIDGAPQISVAVAAGVASAAFFASGFYAWNQSSDCREMLQQYPLYVPPRPAHSWDGVVVTSDRRDVKGCDLINNFEARTSKTTDSIEKLKAIVYSAGGNVALLVGESRDRLTQIAEAYACAPAGSTTAPAAASGCTKDTECKGDRICSSGSCVDPPITTQPPSSAP